MTSTPPQMSPVPDVRLKPSVHRRAHLTRLPVYVAVPQPMPAGGTRFRPR